MLSVQNISSGYGKKQVLYNMSFSVEENEIVLLMGGNGSGKTTILKCIYNVLPLWEGKIHFSDEKISDLEPHDLIKKGIVYIPQKNNYFENLTIEENLEVSGTIYSRKKILEKIEKIYNELEGLKKYRNRTPFSLSGGERQILAFGMALMHDPKLILFDEPFAGLDKNNANKFKSKIIEIKRRENISFIIVEHSKNTDSLADRVIKLSLGRLN